MNYRSLIAFLGKNQMKDWATTGAEWIPALGASGSWTNEFVAIKNLKTNSDPVHVENYASLAGIHVYPRSIDSTGKKFCPEKHWPADGYSTPLVGLSSGSHDFEYMEKYDVILSYIRKTAPSIIKKLKDYVQSCYESGNFEEKKIDEL